MDTKIIDVSSNNGIVDWNKIANAGVEEVFIRLSLGYNDMDRNAMVNANGAARADLIVGYYHFAYPDKTTGTHTGDAKQEANYFTGLFANGKMPAPAVLALDLENWSAAKDSPLTKTEYMEWVNVFLSEVKAATGIDCMIYSYKGYLDSHLPADHNLGGVSLWIANYNNVAMPPLPIGWTKYALWQYSEKGSLPGVEGVFDLSKGYDLLG